jgi:hypothetical protein
MYKIYIASPYTIGWQNDNVKRQIDAAHLLMDKGFAPYTPLLTHFQAMVHPRPESDWLKLDLEYLKICDAVFRIIPRDDKGNIIPSSGADLEEKTAKENNIPVFHFYSIKNMEDTLKNETYSKILFSIKKNKEERRIATLYSDISISK